MSAPEFFIQPATYIFSGMNILCVFFNFANLNKTVALYSQMQTMPMYESCIIFGNLLSGGLIMNEFSYYERHQLAFIFTGCCICVGGIMFKFMNSSYEISH